MVQLWRKSSLHNAYINTQEHWLQTAGYVFSWAFERTAGNKTHCEQHHAHIQGINTVSWSWAIDNSDVPQSERWR